MDFCPAARAGAYDDDLFDSRSRFIAGGFYEELIERLRTLLDRYAPAGPVLDAGCGEGSFLKAILPRPRGPALHRPRSLPAWRSAGGPGRRWLAVGGG